MRRRTATALGTFAGAVLLGFLGRAADSEALYFLSGLLFLVAVGLGVALLPVWDRWGLRLPPMRLFPKPGPGEAWDPTTGTVVRTSGRGKPPKGAVRRRPRP